MPGSRFTHGSLPLLVIALVASLPISLAAQTAPAASTLAAAPAPTPPDASPAGSAKAHALLNRAVHINGPSVAGAAPWHLKADFQWQTPGQPVGSGSIEEWWKGPDQWRRTYTVAKTTWTEWSVDRTHQYQPPGYFLYRAFLELRIATPLITPLFQAKNFLPEYNMQVESTHNGLDMNCISIADPGRYVNKIDPDFLFPKYCLDKLGVLRGVMTSNTTVTFADFAILDNRAVAKTVDVFVDGKKVSESKVSLLELLAPADQALLQPAPDAVLQPVNLTASDPRPVLLHSEKPIIPAAMVIAGAGGPITIAVTIGKDGKVKPAGPAFASAGGGGLALLNSAVDAAKAFRYQPYLIDGQPVEVSWNISFSVGRNGYEAPPLGEEEKPTGFDPKRDPQADLLAAEATAKQTHKNILLDVGGDWCIWCAHLEHFFVDHPDLQALLDANYVKVKVNWSEENHNNAFLAQFADINTFPFLIVLDENGKLLQAQRTNVLEKGDSYDPDKVRDFLNHYKPSPGLSTASIP